MTDAPVDPAWAGTSRRGMGRELLRWEACGYSGAGFGPFFARARPVSNRDRRVRTRKHGGVGPVAGSLSQSRGPDSAPVVLSWVAA